MSGAHEVQAAVTAAENGEEPKPRPVTVEKLPEPLDNLKDATPWLRRPFAPEAIRAKVQSKWGNDKALVVYYQDARLVIDRLNACLPGLWWDEYELLGKAMLCRLTVDGITRVDVGEGNGAKALVSDSLKRAAVKFGVGVPTYAAPRCVLDVDGKQIKRLDKGGLMLLEAGGTVARGKYAEWLESAGVRAFGAALDHGDVDESGSLDDEGAEGQLELGVEAPPALLVDEAADNSREQCRALYREIVKVKGARSKLPPARFNDELVQASTSHEALAAFYASLLTLQRELRSKASGDGAAEKKAQVPA